MLPAGITHINVSRSIDLVLVQEDSSEGSVRMNDAASKKVEVSCKGNALNLRAKISWFSMQRLRIYVYVKDLQKISAEGNASVTTEGVLGSRQIAVLIDGNAVVSLRTKGNVEVSGVGDTEVSMAQRKIPADLALRKPLHPRYQ